jgi:hypothetical protein
MENTKQLRLLVLAKKGIRMVHHLNATLIFRMELQLMRIHTHVLLLNGRIQQSERLNLLLYPEIEMMLYQI